MTRAVDERPRDHAVDLVEPVAQDRDPDPDRDERDREDREQPEDVDGGVVAEDACRRSSHQVRPWRRRPPRSSGLLPLDAGASGGNGRRPRRARRAGGNARADRDLVQRRRVTPSSASTPSGLRTPSSSQSSNGPGRTTSSEVDEHRGARSADRRRASAARSCPFGRSSKARGRGEEEHDERRASITSDRRTRARRCPVRELLDRPSHGG